MEQWLEQRLTPYKQKEPRWRDLARALQEYWDLYNTPYLERLDNLRSVFSAHDEDIETLMREAGIQFEVALPVMQDNRSLAYAWRSYEVHRKDRKHTIEGILSRDYSNLFVRWVPLYAPRHLEYGHRFLSPMEFELYNYTMDDMYQTYRGILVTNLTHLYQHGSDKYDFGAAAQRKMDILRPAHITYEGALYFQVFKAEFPIPIKNSASHEFLTMPLPWVVKRRFDESRADDFRLDDRLIFVPHGTSGPVRHVEKPVLIWPFEDKLWSLDAGSYADGFYWAIHGAEGKRRGRFGPLGDRSDSFFLHNDKIESFIANKSAKERLSGNFFSLIRRFDDYAADRGAADLGGLGFEVSKAKATQFDAWPFEKLWSLDAGSVVDGEYLGLAGIEGAQRGRHGTLSSKSGPTSILVTGLLEGDSAASKTQITGKAFIPEHFDLEKADACVVDYSPMASAGRDTSTGGRFWPMPLWGLDLATCEEGRLLGLAGKEGAELSRSGSISTEKHSFLNKILLSGYRVGSGLSSGDKMAPRINADGEDYSGGSAKLTRSKSAVAQVKRRELPKHPSLDDIPADFAPLDMTYQPESCLL